MVLRILTAVSDRADSSPLAPVIRELRHRGHFVKVIDLSGRASPAGTASTFEHALGHSDVWDVLLLLGDRSEMLVAATVATVRRIPIAHIHGGETTYGSYDNQIRDAVTKLAVIHFPAAEPFRQRIISLGERPALVFTVGAPGLDMLVDLPDRNPGNYFVVTYQPATLGGPPRLDALLALINRLPHERVLVTGPNRDPGWAEIDEALRPWIIHPTPREYLLLCRQAAVVIGNSSSGIIEAPSLGVPSVNIGPRQGGRLHGPSVFDAPATVGGIAAAVKAAMAYAGPFDNPYDAGPPGASVRIADALERIDFSNILVKGAP